MRRSRKRANHARGMTLIEIMVVLVILGMIASAIGISVMGNQREANKRAAMLDVQQLSNAVDMYRLIHSSLPETIDQLVPNQVARIRKDPWGNAYVFIKSGETFQVLSYGPDKAQGGGDDILMEPEGKS